MLSTRSNFLQKSSKKKPRGYNHKPDTTQHVAHPTLPSSCPAPRPDRNLCTKMTNSPSYVDRSNTNWSPWPRLSGVPQRLQVIGGIGAIMTTAYVLYSVRKSVAPPPPATMSKEWQEATKKRMEAAPREAAGPVAMNPITRSRGE